VEEEFNQNIEIMITYTVLGFTGNITADGDTGKISMGVDLATGELVVETEEDKIKIPFEESKELVGLIRQKQALYEDLERKKQGFFKNFLSIPAKKWGE
jgi:hypothetical protein